MVLLNCINARDPMYRKIIFLCLLMPGTIGALPYPVNDDESRAVKFLERARILYERSDYDSLPYYYREAGKYFKTRDMHERVAECMLGMVDYYRLNNLNSNAGRTLAEAESYIESQLGKNSESWADALYVRAKLSMVQNRLEESIKILGECRELQR